MELYLYNLIKQYQSALGIKEKDINFPSFMTDFNEWLKDREFMGEIYINFIESIDDYWVERHQVEVGKGMLDSLVLDSDDTIITPYFEGIENKPGLIIPAEFYVYDGQPLAIHHQNNEIQLQTVDLGNSIRFSTHNPYEPKNIQNWEQLLLTGNDITVGVFGSRDDKDFKEKIKQLEPLKDKLEQLEGGNYYSGVNYETLGDCYYYALWSNPKVKRLEKTLRR